MREGVSDLEELGQGPGLRIRHEAHTALGDALEADVRALQTAPEDGRPAGKQRRARKSRGGRQRRGPRQGRGSRQSRGPRQRGEVRQHGGSRNGRGSRQGGGAWHGRGPRKGRRAREGRRQGQEHMSWGKGGERLKTGQEERGRRLILTHDRQARQSNRDTQALPLIQGEDMQGIMAVPQLPLPSTSTLPDPTQQSRDQVKGGPRHMLQGVVLIFGAVTGDKSAGAIIPGHPGLEIWTPPLQVAHYPIPFFVPIPKVHTRDGGAEMNPRPRAAPIVSGGADSQAPLGRLFGSPLGGTRGRRLRGGWGGGPRPCAGNG